MYPSFLLADLFSSSKTADALTQIFDFYKRFYHGDVEQARQQAERCIQQAEEGGWLDSDGRPLRLRGRVALWRIYSRMADSLLDAEDYDEALTLLHRGYSMAAASEDKQVEAEAAYRLGLTNQRAGHHNTAKQFFNMCMQIFGTLEDADGLGKSYTAMAKSLESEENVDETVRCLEKLADISLKSGLQHNLVDAYLSLGNIYFNRSQYSRACEFFLQGYEVARDLGDIPLLEKTQEFVATARAHCLIRKYSADLKSATPTSLRRLLAWRKPRAAQDFSSDSPDDPESTMYP
ncbi:tetratricopeptide repeat protein 29 [Labrus mixtus]|uniref:tetratricopeptide repeat protein 29 n=1 Tax=Labrus mixtus TaxID=508554 RepID=UPI0029BFD6C7|nr:tetratricopeptide repeat protein 29 [Labrus mixtus]